MKLRFGILALLSLVPARMSQGDTLQSVAHVDLARYAGRWYEIARLPFSKQEGCFASTATYSLRPDGRIDVLNECRQGAFDGKPRKVKGVAKVVEPATGSKLKVQFFWPFWGDYWVIALDENYQYAMVGEPRRRYLWILSRTPELGERTYQELVKAAEAQGYSLAQLTKTPQKEN